MRAGRDTVRRQTLSRAGACARATAGVTLVELLVAMVCALLVLSAGATVLVLTFRQQNYISSRDVAKDSAETGLEQLQLDLREAVSEPSISVAGATTTLAFEDPAPDSGGSGSEPVTWTCTASSAAPGSCTRVLGAGANAQSTREIVGVESFTVAPYSNDGSRLSLPTTSSSPVSAVSLQLAVQDSAYGLTSAPGTATAAVPQSRTIDLTALADLRNES